MFFLYNKSKSGKLLSLQVSSKENQLQIATTLMLILFHILQPTSTYKVLFHTLVCLNIPGETAHTEKCLTLRPALIRYLIFFYWLDETMEVQGD